MTAMTDKFKYLITDGCDENGEGQFTIRVSETQLEELLARGFIYEDTISDYVESSGRRHFHPMHEGSDMADVVRTVDIGWAAEPTFDTEKGN